MSQIEQFIGHFMCHNLLGTATTMFSNPVGSFVALSLVALWEGINVVHGDDSRVMYKNRVLSSTPFKDRKEPIIPAKETNFIVEKYERVIRLPGDTRSYRGLKLSNEMSVVLISDPSTDISAASLAVGVGTLSDFPDVPGLANLVGYMMSYGGQDDSNASKVLDYLNRPGSCLYSPTLKSDVQIFGFEVNSPHLGETLDWFAKAFADPLVLDAPNWKVLESVMCHVQQDFEWGQALGDYRILEVEKLTCRPDSVFARLSLGNKTTLLQHAPTEFTDAQKLISLTKKMSQFYKIWYSSNIMSLVVLGKEDLDILQEMAVLPFAKVPNKRRTPFRFPPGHFPWGPDQMRNKIYVVPLENIRRLRLHFPFPDDPRRFKDTPERYFSYFMNQDGAGSLSSTLRKRDYCNDLSGKILSAAGVALYTITCELTNRGTEHGVDDIIHLVFQYLHLMKTEGIHETFFKQIQIEGQLEFFYGAAQMKPAERTRMMAHLMQVFPVEDVLSYHRLSGEWWNTVLIAEILGYLRPDNMNVTIVSQTFAHIATQTEERYGTKYAIHKIEDERIKEWSNIDTVIPELKLPQRNEFVPNNFDIYPRDEEEPKHPRIIYKSTKLEIWFRQDDAFRVPDGQVIFELHSSQARNMSPFGNALWRIYVTALNIHLEKHFKSATKARFEWEIESTNGGVRVILNGPGQKLPLLLKRVLSVMVNLGNDIGEPLFRIARESGMFSYLDVMKTHFDYTTWYKKFLEREKSWSVDSIVQAAGMLQRKEFRKLLSKSFRRIFIQGFVHGNCTKDNAMKIVAIMEKYFQSGQGLLAQEVMFGRRLVELVDGSVFLQQIPFRLRDVFGHTSSFQLHTKPSTRNNVIGFLLLGFISAKCEQMQQIWGKDDSATTTCLLEGAQGIQEFVIMTRSEREPRNVEKNTEKFMQNILENLTNLSESHLEPVRTAVETKRYSELSQVERARRYWTEIADQLYDFDRVEKERCLLFSLEKDELMTFFKENLAAERRRRLVVQLFPADIEQTKLSRIMKRSIPWQAVKIGDHVAFQTSLSLLPLNFNPLPAFANDDTT